MRLTGLSRGAIEARVQRGTLPAEKVGGRLRFELEELYRQGLVPGASLAGTVSELLDRLEERARRVAELERELDDYRKGKP
jgi:hypothetical protein